MTSVSYKIKPSIDYYSELLVLELIWECLHDPQGTGGDGFREFLHGNHVLIVNQGGIQNANMQPEVKALLKDYDWWNIYNLLPEMPKPATGKFTGKIILHTNEGTLQEIEFIPKIKP